MAGLTLWQAEWCPFSSAVREVLTELGLDYAIRQVEPWLEDRARLREATGTDRIPVLVDEDGVVHRGTRAIFEHLRGREPWRHAKAHRHRYLEHVDSRHADTVEQLLEHFDGPKLDAAKPAAPADAEVVHVPERARYELRVDGRTVGHLAYHRRDGHIAFTHTEIAAACEGRGLGSKLVATALDDARRDGLEVAPLCPFVRWFVERHPEYAPLVAPGHRR